MTIIEIKLLVVIVILTIKIFKQLEYIRLYTLILMFYEEGKLIPENDPKGLADKAAKELKKNALRYF